MALPSTGTITFAMINKELGHAENAPISLNQADVRALAGKLSGAISFPDLRGKSHTPPDVTTSILVVVTFRVSDPTLIQHIIGYQKGKFGTVHSVTPSSIQSDYIFATYSSGSFRGCFFGFPGATFVDGDTYKLIDGNKEYSGANALRVVRNIDDTLYLQSHSGDLDAMFRNSINATKTFHIIKE